MPSPAIVVRIFQYKKFFFSSLTISSLLSLSQFSVRFRSINIFVSFLWHSIECILCSISIFYHYPELWNFFHLLHCRKPQFAKWMKRKKNGKRECSCLLVWLPLTPAHCWVKNCSENWKFHYYLAVHFHLYRRTLPKFMESLIGYEITPF